ncbi:MAG: hypothetical protein AABZ30_12565 [Myxococcota bacterium]
MEHVEYRERMKRPVLWWEVAALERPGTQVFARWFSEFHGEAVTMCRKLSVEIKMREYLQPIEDWQVLSVRETAREEAWGESGAFIEDWFEAGTLTKETDT